LTKFGDLCAQEIDESKILGEFPRISADLEGISDFLKRLKNELADESRIHRYRDELKLLDDVSLCVGNLEKTYINLQEKKKVQEEIRAKVDQGVKFIETVITYLKETAPCAVAKSGSRIG
jgi:CHASE3 domain sensor protein